jgi:hypothetical protein
LIWQHRLRRLLAGHYFMKPMKYAIYTMQSEDKRVEFDAHKPTTIWWNRYSSLPKSLILGG